MRVPKLCRGKYIKMFHYKTKFDFRLTSIDLQRVNILIELANLSARSATVENFKEYKDKSSVTIASHLNHPTKGNQNVPRLNCLR